MYVFVIIFINRLLVVRGDINTYDTTLYMKYNKIYIVFIKY